MYYLYVEVVMFLSHGKSIMGVQTNQRQPMTAMAINLHITVCML